MPYTTEQIKTTPHKWTPTVETFRTMKSSWPDVIHVGYDEMLIDYEGERVINGLYRVTSVQSYDIRGSNLLFQFKGDGATSGTAPRCIVKRHSQAPPEVWWGDTTVQRSMKFFEEYMVTHLKEHPLSSLSDMEICQRFIHQDMHELLV